MDSEDAAALEAYWRAKTEAALARLRCAPPYPVARTRSSVSLRLGLGKGSNRTMFLAQKKVNPEKRKLDGRSPGFGVP